MSIFATYLLLDGEGWGDALDAVEGRDEKGLGAPYVYHGSHVLPTAESERGGVIEVGAIPAYCGTDPTQRVDFLRLGVTAEDELHFDVDATVLLDRRQVTALRDCLTDWLTREPEIG